MKSMLNEFIRERDEALRSLDELKIKAYMEKWGVPLPPNEEIFWRAVHKARCDLKTFTEEEKELSREWLYSHGSNPGVRRTT